MEDNIAFLHLLHLTDSSFPVGGYAHSSGLEKAIESGWVKDGASLYDWIEEELVFNFGSSDARACFHSVTFSQKGDLPKLQEISMELASLRVSKVQRDAQQQMALSMLDVVDYTFGNTNDISKSFLVALRQIKNPQYAVIFGAICGQLGIKPKQATLALLSSFVTNKIQVAVRLVPLGQNDANLCKLIINKKVNHLHLESIFSAQEPLSSSSIMSDFYALGQDNLKKKYFIS